MRMRGFCWNEGDRRERGEQKKKKVEGLEEGKQSPD